MNVPDAFFTSRVTEALASLAVHVTSARNIAASLKPIKTTELDLVVEEAPRPIITSISPSRIPFVFYADVRDFTIKGKNLTEDSVNEFELFFEDDPDNVYPAELSAFTETGFTASVNLSGAAPGFYEVRIRDVNGTPHLPGLTVEIEADESYWRTSKTPASSGNPKITIQPKSATLGEGERVSLKVEATGISRLSYQWYRDGQLLAGKTTKTLNISKATDVGNYWVVVMNKAGAVVSTPATVTVKSERPT